MNALYLDAPWKYRFDAASTQPRPFTRFDGSRVNVPMMHFNDFLPSGRGVGWQAVELPYRGDELSMVVIVPEDLRAFQARLTPAFLDQLSRRSRTAASTCRCRAGSSRSTPRW